MAIITTATLIVAGVACAISAAGGIWYAATEVDRANEKIKQLQAENKQLESAKQYVNNIKDKLTKSKEYLEQGKKEFKNGGHVYDDVPLANSEFKSCIDKLDSAILNAKNLIDDFNATIDENNKKINSISAELQKSHETMKKAAEKQHERRDGALGNPKTTSVNKTNKPRHR